MQGEKRLGHSATYCCASHLATLRALDQMYACRHSIRDLITKAASGWLFHARDEIPLSICRWKPIKH